MANYTLQSHGGEGLYMTADGAPTARRNVYAMYILKHESQTVLIRLGELIRQAMVHGQEFFPVKVITLGVMR